MMTTWYSVDVFDYEIKVGMSLSVDMLRGGPWKVKG